MIIIPDAKYFISVLFVFIFILAAAYYVTKLIAKNGNYLIKSRNMKVIERVSLGMDKTLYLMNIGKNYYVIAAGKQNIQLIDKINEGEIKIISDDSEYKKYNNVFDNYLDKYLNEENELMYEDNKDIDNFTNLMMSKLKEMKKRNEGLKHYTDREEK